MDISVEAAEGLKRRMTVQVPEEEIENQVDSRLKSMAKDVRMKGFRPGKVPFRLVRQHYAGQVRQEVLGEVVNSSFQDAVAAQKLRLAGVPEIEPMDPPVGGNFSYTAVFEVYPDIELASLEGLTVTKPVAEVTDEDLERMIENLRQQRAIWNSVDRAAVEDDRLEISFKGTVDGQPFEGGDAEHAPLVLGSGGRIPGFDDKLVGVKAGETVVLDLQIPDDYRVADVAGKAVQFKVDALSVAERVVPDVDENFARSFGVESGNLDDFRNEVHRNMQREMDRAIRARVKEQVMGLLLEQHSLEVPQALVEEEMTRLIEQAVQQAPEELKQQYRDLPRSVFEDRARRRVVLGLLLTELIQANRIKVDSNRVRQMIEGLAEGYDNPQRVVSWYYDNPEQIASMESLVVEDQVVDWVLGRVAVKEERTRFDDLVNPQPATTS